MIVAVMPFLIYDALEAIQYTCVIYDFTILAQYVLYDNETLRYIEHALCRMEKTIIAFEHHRLINFMLCEPIFNYPKFHIMNQFVQCIWDYGSAVNYNIAYSKAAYKYLFKVFYNRPNKKEFNLQIWQHNVRHNNILAMKDVIVIEKAREKKRLSKGIADTTAPAVMAWASSLIDLAGRYIWAMNNADLDAAKELGLIGIKKY